MQPSDQAVNTGAMPARASQLERLGRETFDLAIIGGGINGAAIARDAAMRGLSVALIDRGDFAGATSSRSSKLIHGGLRYLPQGQFRLVYQALRERELLRRLTAPHLARPIRFLFPFYGGRRPGRFAVSAGLMLYDFIARTPAEERHRRVGIDDALDLEPSLRAEGLTGAALYFDGWGDDARLTLENVIDAAIHGAAVANYLAVESFARAGGRIAGAAVRDCRSDTTFDLRARQFVNAAGPWADDIRRLDDVDAPPRVRLTKGVHLVVAAARLPLRNALVLTDDAGRIVFAMPHRGWQLIGTTDTDYAGDPAAVRAGDDDLDYLLGVVNAAIPGAGLGRADVAHSFAGLRALAAGDGRRPSAVPREEVIVESPSGLITVAGGKLTTHREIAARIVARLATLLGRPAGKSPTLTIPLPGARALAGGADANSRDGLSAETRAILDERYGTRAAMVGAIARRRPELAAPIAPGARAIWAEVVHAARAEMALTTADFLIRRVAMTWRNPRAARAAAPEVARMLAVELGWSERQCAADLADFFAAADLRVDAPAGVSDEISPRAEALPSTPPSTRHMSTRGSGDGG